MLDKIKIVYCADNEYFKEILDDCIEQMLEIKKRLEVSDGNEF